jgi:hypothetical protein
MKKQVPAWKIVGKAATPDGNANTITKTVFPKWLILAIVGAGLACCVGLTACWAVVVVRRRRKEAAANQARRGANYASDGGAPGGGQWAAPVQQQPEGKGGKGSKAKRLVPGGSTPNSGGKHKGRSTRTPQPHAPPQQPPPPRSHAHMHQSSADEDDDGEGYGRLQFSGRQPSAGIPAKRGPSGGEW